MNRLLDYFRTPITPNDEFFIRYHLSDIPDVDVTTYKIAVGGDGANGQTELTLDDLKKIPAIRNRRGQPMFGQPARLSNPHVAGVEWGYGAMGCARWKGARLKDVLDIVGLKTEAIEIAFNGADGPAFDKTPDFIKSIPVWKAIDESTLIAYEMNGAPLPHFNGFPARLIVPGWTGTYWMKHLISDHRADQAAGRFLDEPGLPHSGRHIPGGGAFRFSGKRHLDADHGNCRQLADHQPLRWRQSEARQQHHQRPGLGRRLWHRRRRNIHGRRQDLVGGDVGDDLGRYAFRPWISSSRPSAAKIR